MGPRFNKLQKANPEIIPHIFKDVRLLKMVGAKYTDLTPGYTKRYDHGLISMEAIEQLAQQVTLKDLDLTPPPPTSEEQALNELLKSKSDGVKTSDGVESKSDGVETS